MAKQKKIARMMSPDSPHARGRTAKSTHPDAISPEVAELKTRSNRAMGTGATGTGKLRGDRRDTSRLYTGNTKHAARGNSPRADVKTRKR